MGLCDEKEIGWKKHLGKILKEKNIHYPCRREKVDFWERGISDNSTPLIEYVDKKTKELVKIFDPLYQETI